MIVGARGFIGAPIAEHLSNLGFRRVVKTDLTAKDGCLPPQDAVGIISEMNMVVVVTARGEDFTPYAEHLTSGTTVIDDTHPKIRGELRNTIIRKGCLFYKVAVCKEGTMFRPGLPGYGPVESVPYSRWPGCAVEAFVKASSKRGHEITEQTEFDLEAERLGLRPVLTS